MAQHGSKQRLKKLHLAQQEYFAAIEQFAESMKTANLGYIADHIDKDTIPMTWNMRFAMNRYIAACYRIKELRG